jgi:proline iminopeptidase
MSRLARGEFDLETPEGVLHYTVTGKGPACITLSGGPGLDARYLGDLGGIGETLTLIHLHPRGSGLSRHPDQSDWSLAAFARDVETLRRHLSLEHPFVLGHSHGGMVAQQYAFDYPEMLGGLILVGTSASFEGWTPEYTTRRYATEPWYPDAEAALHREPSTDEEAKADFDAVLPFYFAHTGRELQALRKQLATYRMNLAPARSFNIQTLDLRAQLGGIRAPTLVLAGEDDWICTVPMAEVLVTRILGAQLVVFPDCGHFCWLEAQERFHAAVRAFVRAQGASIARTSRGGVWGLFRRHARAGRR